jgi:hypothetical protein
MSRPSRAALKVSADYLEPHRHGPHDPGHLGVSHQQGAAFGHEGDDTSADGIALDGAGRRGITAAVLLGQILGVGEGDHLSQKLGRLARYGPRNEDLAGR